MRKITACGAFILLAITGMAATNLSQNTGINPGDSHVIFNVTLRGQATVTLQEPVYNVSTGSTTTSVPTNRTVNYRVEAGYDPDGQLVMNVFSLDPPADPTTTTADGVLLFRLAKGKLVLFDEEGKPMPLVLPEGFPLPDPLQFLGPNPGSSVVKGMVISNMEQAASEMGATVQYSYAAPGSSAPTTATLTAAVAASGGGYTTWTYQQQGSLWILTNAGASSSISGFAESRDAQITVLSWYTNATADAGRAAQGSTAQPPPNSWAAGPEFPEFTPPSESAATVEPGCSASGTGQNIVFQHGLFSSCGTWTHRMYPWLNEKFQFGTVLIPSLPSTARLDSQASDLFNIISNSGQSNFLILGHSQGGLLARDFAQRNQAAGRNLLRGVITMNTPHNGARLALSSRIAVGQALGGLILHLAGASCFSPTTFPACPIAFFLARVSFGVVIANTFDVLIPSSTDLIPGSAYLQRINSFAENFPRVGIEGHPTRRWVLMRLGGDSICDPESGCGGRAWVSATDSVYFAMRACEILALLIQRLPSIFAFCGLVANIMDAVDIFYNFALVAPFGEGSDGLVDNASQVYPAATARYPVTRADSHVGSTKSDKTRVAVERAFDEQFQVPRVGCTFSISPASASFSAQGGTGSLTVTTGTACRWSATSSDGWVAVTSGMTGSGSATVSFTVAANFSPVPRTATIEVQEQVMTITQAGATSCIYVLSPTSTTVFSAGGSGTVTVTTQPGCVWAATSSQPWIIIVSGASGTGSGSFSWEVAPLETTQNRSGTIRVADQVFSILQRFGDPSCFPARFCE